MSNDVLEEVEIPILAVNKEKVPTYGSDGAAGADVRANIRYPVAIAPGSAILVPTGVFLEIPEGYEVQIRPRSGLAFNHQVTVLNSPGTIDSDYRGEVQIILINHSKETFVVTPDMRIAQLVVAPVVRAKFIFKEELTTTCRGANGFGSTGTH